MAAVILHGHFAQLRGHWATNENCDYTAEMEPDQDRGYCESCGTNTVASALVLAEVI